MTFTEKVQIVVYDAPSTQAGSCACGCGGHHHEQGDDPLADTHLEFQTRALAMTLEAAFPGKVELEYINVLKDPRGPRLPQTPLLCSLAYPPPLVYINGRARFAGALPVERIREEVRQILEG
ncbi:MAG: YbbN family protein [Desulfobaccales bacterium]